MEVSIRFAFAVVVFVIMDQCAPQILRTYAVGVVPWGEKETVAVFNRRYGRVRFPRTVFLVAAALLLAFASEETRVGRVFLGAGLMVAVVWISTAGVDIWKASRGLMPRDPG